MALPRHKVVVVGDGSVGKTCLLISFADNKFPEEYVPTVFENHAVNVSHEKHGDILLDLWDTAGQEEFDRIRPLSYTDTDTCLVCFSLVARRSMESVRDRWVPEIRHYVPDVPFLLVGLKLDLRESNEPDHYSGKVEPVSTEEGESLSKTLGARGYYECSSRTREKVAEVFAAAIETSYEYKHPRESRRRDTDRRAAASGGEKKTPSTSGDKKSTSGSSRPSSANNGDKDDKKKQATQEDSAASHGGSQGSGSHSSSDKDSDSPRSRDAKKRGFCALL